MTGSRGQEVPKLGFVRTGKSTTAAEEAEEGTEFAAEEVEEEPEFADAEFTSEDDEARDDDDDDEENSRVKFHLKIGRNRRNSNECIRFTCAPQTNARLLSHTVQCRTKWRRRGRKFFHALVGLASSCMVVTCKRANGRALSGESPLTVW